MTLAESASGSDRQPWPLAPVPQWAPPQPPPRRRALPAIIALCVVVLLALAAVGWVFRSTWLPAASASPDGGGPTPTAAPTTARAVTATPTVDPGPTQPPATSAAPSPSAVGVVAIDPSVDPSRGYDVAVVFDTYFSGINTKDYQRAVSVYDPAGVVNPTDPKSVSSFSQGVSTTTDSEIVLHSVADDTTGKGVAQARFTFTSQQSPGYGPGGRTAETCTHWDITYILSRPTGGYLIKGVSTVLSSPC